MKAIKIRQIFMLSLFLSQYNFIQPCKSQNNLSPILPITEDVLLAGWKPRNNYSQKDIKPNIQTKEALDKFKKISALKPYFKKARGYAVFPNVGKVGIGIGGARGKGEVFEKGKVIGSTTLTQLSIGFQLGGQAFRQIIFFKDEKAIKRFTEGNFEFGASASAVLILDGANASADYSEGVAVHTSTKGGLMYEASIGGKKFSYDEY